MKAFTLSLFFLLLFFCQAALGEEKIIFVDQSAEGQNNGTSWKDAFVDLQDALKIAAYGDNIWIANGKYYPTTDNDREIKFRIRNGFKLYGGFSGSELALEERNISVNETILSGDIGVKNDSLDNSLNVVYIDSADVNTLLDGLTISDGYAVHAQHENRYGGAVFQLRSSTTYNNCTFRSNFAGIQGGAVYLGYGSSVFNNCRFFQNRSHNDGGAVAAIRSTPVFQNCIFEKNSAGNLGGAVRLEKSDATFENCKFIRNGIIPSSRNYPSYAGGAMSVYWSSPRIRFCLFFKNHASYNGDALEINYDSRPYVESSRFVGDYISPGVAGYEVKNTVYIWNGAQPAFVNCLFINGIVRSRRKENAFFYPVFNNCTFYEGGLIFDNPQSSNAIPAIINNSILWNAPVSSNEKVAIKIFNSIVNLPVEGLYEGVGNFDADPLFINPEGEDHMAENADDYFSLQEGSPAINAGSVLVPQFEKTIFDLAGNPRILDHIDIGAYENSLRAKTISGRVFNDQNKNCIKEAPEKGLGNVLIGTSNEEFFTVTDEDGFYTLLVDEGVYEIQAKIIGDERELFTQLCPSGLTHSTDLTDSDSADNLNFGFFRKDCDLISVSVETDPKRRCFTSETFISYKNLSDEKIEKFNLYVQYPEFIVPLTSNREWVLKEDNIYEFSLENARAGSSYLFTIKDSVICGDESVRGKTQCIKAWVESAYTCAEPGAGWDGSDLQIRGFCSNEEKIAFTIFNYGTEMADSSEFRIYENAEFGFKKKLQLTKGDSLYFEIDPSGKTYRLEVDQALGHPLEGWTQKTIEACGLDENGNFVPGFVNKLPTHDPRAWKDMSCNQIVDSFDPNDKKVQPNGVGAQHIVEPGVTLNYTIRFENTGTATAFTIVIVDTLSANLDVSTISKFRSSVYFDMEIFPMERPVLVFKTLRASLPPSIEDEEGSQGFISFSILPKADIPLQTVIENFGDIYFDYNSPIRTNTTRVVIDEIPLKDNVFIDQLNFFCEYSVETKSDTTVLCQQDVHTLSTDGYPPGGNFTGNGVTGNEFNATMAGPGVSEIIYSYHLGSYCPKEYKQYIEVEECEVTGFATLEREIQIFPVPAENQLCISSPNFNLHGAELSLKDLTGKELLKEKLLFKGITTHCLDLTSCPGGMYVLHVLYKKESFNKKIIVSK